MSAAAGLSIWMIASEAVPFVKSGGLADVVGALPVALGRLGHQVTLVLPRYRGIDLATPSERWLLRVGGRDYDVEAYERRLAPGVEAVLIGCPELYDREGLYGVGTVDYPDNARRFAVLARAALELAVRRGAHPSLVHTHEWQGGLAPVYLRTLYRDHPLLGNVPAVFSIHNLAYQGLFPPSTLPVLDLKWEVFTMEGLEYWGQVSLLKAGINFSDKITTVSRRYAAEILTPECGFGFDGILARRRHDLVGIVNGIDTNAWDPERDPYLPEPFSARGLGGKRAAKRAVLKRYGLPATGEALDRPLIGMISRLVTQKGLDLVAEIAAELPQLDATFVVLGTGEPRYQKLWLDLATGHPDRIGVHIGFNERLAHLIEAGADMFLMPSRFEPCGLNQMYSLRYGTVPIVRATGGLDDTVKAYHPRTGRGTGFKFREYSGRALRRALEQALRVFRDTDRWRALQVAGMQEDHSWDTSAREYVKVYVKAIRRRAVTGRPGPMAH